MASEPQHIAIAKRLVKKHHLKAIDGLLYRYNGSGLYVCDALSVVEREAQRQLGAEVSTHLVNEILSWIRRDVATSRESFDFDPSIVNVANCRLNVRTGAVDSHSAEHLSLVQVASGYDPGATCPTVQRFMSEVLKPEDVPLVEELFGYCLLRSYPIHKAFLLVGEGENGKSSLIELLRTFLGVDNCASLSIQELEDDRFARADLSGKLANLFADLPTKPMNHIGVFKMLTGGDTLSADRKFRERVSFKNHAKVVFSTNRPPKVYGEDSFAFWRRWIVVDFPYSFTGRADRNLLAKMTTKQELAGLLNLALVGLRRLLDREQFSYDCTPDQVAEKYARLADPVLSFVDEECVLEPDATVRKDVLYTAYVDHCESRGETALTKESFGRSLRNQSKLQVACIRQRDGDERQYAYRGIALKDWREE
ncbi:phage/plasmid primase, P4 family [Chloroflexota bacterium]